MSGSYVRRLDHNVRLFIEFTTRGREVTDYSVTLTMADEVGVRAICVYDSAHGFNADGAEFIDSDQPWVGRAIDEATAEGRAAVLCTPDGRRLVLQPQSPAAA